MKIDPQSSLKDLSSQDIQTLIGWLQTHSLRKVVAMVAAPRPDGFVLHTYVTTLRRLYARYRKEQRAESLQLAAETTSTPAEDATLDRATVASLRHQAFDLASGPDLNSKQFRALSRWVLKLKDQEMEAQALALARERIELERRKFEFNAAREALNHRSRLAAISHSPQLDNQDKIEAARNLIFGEVPVATQKAVNQ